MSKIKVEKGKLTKCYFGFHKGQAYGCELPLTHNSDELNSSLYRLATDLSNLKENQK
ncbi:hypothetical protein [Streptococcus orisratti]